VYYLDTSVLLVHTLVQGAEPDRHRDVVRLLTAFHRRQIMPVTSFYALHEVFLFALAHAPDPEAGNRFGTGALVEILSLPIRVLPLLTRTERTQHGKRFSKLPDASDIPHAIAAYLGGCQAVVAYDDHFRRLPPSMRYVTPGQLVEELT
jgi:predicted nucleic acid-binding protein